MILFRFQVFFKLSKILTITLQLKHVKRQFVRLKMLSRQTKKFLVGGACLLAVVYLASFYDRGGGGGGECASSGRQTSVVDKTSKCTTTTDRAPSSS